MAGWDDWTESRRKLKESFRGSGHARGAWDLLFDELAGAKFLSIGASKTGNATLVRIRSGGRRVEIRLPTSSIRREGGLEALDELLEALMPTRDAVLDTLTVPPASPVRFYIAQAIGKELLEEARRRGVGILDEIVTKLDAHEGPRLRQDAHKKNAAMDDLRRAVRSAALHGCSFDEMEAVLREETVRTVMEA